MTASLRGRTRVASSIPVASAQVASAMKAKQSRKIGEVRDALIAEGLLTLDEQADALGICRSTAWTILTGKHKASGLSATIINRMLSTAQLPQLARSKIVEYVREKALGLYGHSKAQRRRFVARLTVARGEAENALAAKEARAIFVGWPPVSPAIIDGPVHSHPSPHRDPSRRSIMNAARSSARGRLP